MKQAFPLPLENISFDTKAEIAFTPSMPKTTTTTNAADAMQPAYKIVKDSNGNRAVRLANGNIIPADIAGLCVGPDAWLSEIKCKCRDCKQEFPLRDLNGGGQWCEECQNASIQD